MNLAVGLTQGMQEILGHRLRSTIAMLAIVLGAGSLLATLALTEGIARQERFFLQSLGGVEKVNIREAPIPAGQEEQADITPGMTERDIDALREKENLVAAVSPSHRPRPNPSLTFGRIVLFETRVVCIDPDYHVILRQSLASGRYLTALDIERSRPVCVLANGIVKLLNLTPATAIGKKISLDGELFEIVGTLVSTPAQWLDRDVMVPFTTAFTLFESGKVNSAGILAPVEKFNQMVISVRDAGRLEVTIEDLKKVLLLTHRGVEDFGFDTMQEWSDNIETRITAVRISGSVIAAVSLMVGGIGVTNVMLAAIKQRIREIGVRRAIGAHRSDIFVQIMLEAFILALLGGVLGIIAGWGIVAFFKVAAVSKAIPIILPGALLWSLASAVITGVLAGVYPALRGAAMSPIEALRYE